MMDPQKINDIVQQVMDAIPPALKNVPQDVEANMRAAIQGVFSKLDLVTREEFDAQMGVLQKTRSKIEALEKQLDQLESK